MIYYPNIIACDHDTFHGSKMSEDSFTKLPSKQLKGLSSGIDVYQYATGSKKTKTGPNVIVEPKLPLIGRDEEMRLILEELVRVQQSHVKYKFIGVIEKKCCHCVSTA